LTVPKALTRSASSEHRPQGVGIAAAEACQQGEQRLADRLLVVGRQVRELGDVRMLGAAVNLSPKYRVVAAGG